MSTTDIYWIIFAIFLATLQGSWVFYDARKRGLNYYWLWGIFGLLSVPSALIIYLLVNRLNKEQCPYCGKQINKDYIVCPYCKENLE